MKKCFLSFEMNIFCLNWVKDETNLLARKDHTVGGEFLGTRPGGSEGCFGGLFFAPCVGSVQAEI